MSEHQPRRHKRRKKRQRQRDDNPVKELAVAETHSAGAILFRVPLCAPRLQSRFSEMAISREATPCALANYERRKFGVVRPATSLGLELPHPVEFALFIKGVSHQSDNVAVIRYQHLKNPGAEIAVRSARGGGRR